MSKVRCFWNHETDDKIIKLLLENDKDKMQFNKIKQEIFGYVDKDGNSKTKNQQTLSTHLKEMLEQRIIEIVYEDPNQKHFEFGKKQYYRLTNGTRYKIKYNIFTGVESKRDINKKYNTKTMT